MLTLNKNNEIVVCDNGNLIAAFDKAGNIKGFVTIVDHQWYFITNTIDLINSYYYDDLEELINENSDYTFKFISND